MRSTLAIAAGLVLAGAAAAPATAVTASTAPATAVTATADAPKGAYWRVEQIRTAMHPKPVGSGYHLIERSVSVDWLSLAGKNWWGFRKLGAKPATPKDEAAWRADGSPTSWAYRVEGMKVRVSTRPDKGSVMPTKGRRDGFHVGEKLMTYQQLQALPAEVEPLRRYLTEQTDAWIDKAAEEAKSTDPRATKNDWLVNRDRYVAERAIPLLYENPVPEKVRAAAYQVLKTTKGVTDLGRVTDPLGRSGHKLALPVLTKKNTVLKQYYVVDTRTMTLLAEYTDLKDDRAPVHGKSDTTTFTVGWTNDKPAVPGVS
ncbi:hypothetical protein PS9374_02345 [Planomonospora sphaerica]|uniref:CU044_5270 family protein n=1 Tax=Planomonospora sphaerica TaxID=161355 RepID=A0A161LJN6_9ACTN|nr:hypothetical protein [Planomonospora sphaerica]GAT66695.1 hypothetical protein PS9374_02345 [Planomonospora sphaerica]